MSDQRWLFLCHRRQRCMPTQLHCELENCVISIIHCSLFPQSILCPAPVPRFGRKCSLKASPPTAEAQRSQSAAKILLHTAIPLPSLPCIHLHLAEQVLCRHCYESQYPGAWWHGSYSPLHIWSTCTTQNAHAATHVEADMRRNVTVCLDRPVAPPSQTSWGTPLKGHYGF